ncbi:MAG: uroporphyrinogen decarboxylase family protein [Verrucomicrobia bacterium]|nr:uroporphyrinogen decarboxylase family protein [Verrucomicrobiota bacterium]
MSTLLDFIHSQPGRIGLPVLTFPAGQIIGATVEDFVTRAEVQVAGQVALRERYDLKVLLTCMDLSVEAEAFGCEVALSADEVPTVPGRLVTTREAAEALAIPAPGTARTAVALEAVRQLKALPGGPLVLGGMLGPFSLAARIYGVSDALSLTLEDPELAHLLVEKATRFLVAYAQAFKAAGADGVIMAEPTAGLLSPAALGAFSSAYIHRVVTAVDDAAFTVVLHNCAARMTHLPHVLAAGARVMHFGRPMDVVAALRAAPADRVICGNLDPATYWVQATPDEMKAAARELLAATAGSRNFVLSSGCDVPPKAPLANVDAFFAALREANG